MGLHISRTGLTVSLAVFAGLSFWNASAAQVASGDGTPPASQALAPQMIVKPIPAELLGACRSEALLQQLRDRVAAGEKSQVQAMFDQQDCMPLAEQGMYRILKVHGGLIEIVSFFSRSATGYWAPMASMQAVK